MNFLFVVEYKSKVAMKEAIQEYDKDLFYRKIEEKTITADTLDLAITGLQSYVDGLVDSIGLDMEIVNFRLLNVTA